MVLLDGEAPDARSFLATGATADDSPQPSPPPSKLDLLDALRTDGFGFGEEIAQGRRGYLVAGPGAGCGSGDCAESFHWRIAAPTGKPHGREVRVVYVAERSLRVPDETSRGKKEDDNPNGWLHPRIRHQHTSEGQPSARASVRIVVRRG